MREVLVRAFAVVVGLAAVALVARWWALGATPSELPRDFLPVFVAIAQRTMRRFPFLGGAGMALVAMGVATAGALAAYLAARAGRHAGARRMSLALGCGALSIAYFHLVLPYPIAGRPATALGPAAALALEVAGHLLWLAASWQLVRVWRVFPREVTEAEWERHVATVLHHAHVQLRRGWRRWVYPERLTDPALWEARAARGGLASVVAYGSTARQRARLQSLLESRSGLVVLSVPGIAMATLVWMLRGEVVALQPGERVPAPLATMGGLLPTTYLWVTGIGAVALAYKYLDYHRRTGDDDDRRRIAWIHSTLFAGGVLFLAALLGATAVFVLLVAFALESAGGAPLEALMFMPMAVGVPAFGLAMVVALALSVLYRGSFDPRRAARRVTLWGVLSLVVAIAFVLLERFVALRAADWLALPAEWGPLLAGVLAAATVAPARTMAEGAINRLVERYLPPDVIASGERRASAVALCDLAGYTALSGRDERSALLHAAVLQQKAARIAGQHGGRVVKSMGDAVLMEFPEAGCACSALRALHEQMPAAAASAGLDPLPLHSGAHVGPVVVGPDGDIYGQTVNLAARLQGEAGDGEIIVSAALAAEAGIAAGRLRALGARTLKNVPQPVECCSLVDGAPAPGHAVQPAAIPR